MTNSEFEFYEGLANNTGVHCAMHAVVTVYLKI